MATLNAMKARTLFPAHLVVALAIGCVPQTKQTQTRGPSDDGSSSTSISSLESGDRISTGSSTVFDRNAKVSKADAEKIALTKALGGTIKESELEKEHGKLVWSFDIATPSTKDITEVQVDAVTREVVSVEKENAAQQAAEKKQDEKKK